MGLEPVQTKAPASSAVLIGNSLAKSYGGHLVLKHIDFEIAAGEIVAVIGENGAGKSTFAKIVAGVVQPESGRLQLDGRPVEFQSPRDAIRAGISYIPQELAYLSNLTVAENIVVGRWPQTAGISAQSAIRRMAERATRDFGIEIDVSRQMSTLTLAERQLVEIVKALARRSRVLVLDEPTASLTGGESQKLFTTLRDLAGSGLAIIFISHRMDEIFAVSDRVVVLRNGDVVGDLATAETTHQRLISLMLGAAAEELGEHHESTAGDRPSLRLQGWTWSGQPPIADLNLTVNRGEIVCLFGLRGSGVEVIAESLGGRNRRFTGQVLVEAKAYPIFRTSRAATKAGIGYVPAERKRDGLVMTMSVQANVSLLILRLLSRGGWLQRRRERQFAAEMRDRLRIRLRSLAQNVSTLSGGNQQKVVLASRLVAQPKVLVLWEPTRGVDVGARVEIHHYVRSIATQGTAVLWLTNDVEEAVVVPHRLLVMREGAIVGELAGSDKTQGKALAMATKDAA